jgi:hypothetical protein
MQRLHLEYCQERGLDPQLTSCTWGHGEEGFVPIGHIVLERRPGFDATLDSPADESQFPADPEEK